MTAPATRAVSSAALRPFKGIAIMRELSTACRRVSVDVSTWTAEASTVRLQRDAGLSKAPEAWSLHRQPVSSRTQTRNQVVPVHAGCDGSGEARIRLDDRNRCRYNRGSAWIAHVPCYTSKTLRLGQPAGNKKCEV